MPASWAGTFRRCPWIYTQTALEQESVLRETRLFKLFQFAFGLQGESLSFEDLTLVSYAMPQEL